MVSEGNDSIRSSSFESPEASRTHTNQTGRSEKKRSFSAKLKAIWAKTELDWPSVLQMMKGAVPPTIAIAIYQATDVASVYFTLGYLVGIISVIGFAILPRAKFIQTLILDVVAVCLASACALLMIFCSVKAREHTSAPAAGVQIVPYNSSASAVAGIWLFFLIYVVNSVKAACPQFTFPVIIFSILINVSSVYTPTFASMSQGIAFTKLLMEVFFTGLAIATGVSFLILPITSRQIVFKSMAGYIGTLRGALKAYGAYFEAMEENDMFGRVETYDNKTEKRTPEGKKVYSPEAEAVKAASRSIVGVHGKLHGDLPFAKREIALGNLGPDDMKEIFKQLRHVMIPIVGVSTVVDVFERLSDVNMWNQPLDAGLAEDIHSEAVRARIVHDWNAIMRSVHEPFSHILEVIDEGLQHVLYQLKFAKRPKKDQKEASQENSGTGNENDVEATAAGTAPGDEGFADYLDAQSDQFFQARIVTLQEWCHKKGLDLPEDYFRRHPQDRPMQFPQDVPGGVGQDRNERQLHMILHMEYMLYSSSRAVLEFVRFADDRVASGKLSRTRLIIPGSKQLKKWFLSTFRVQDNQADENIGGMNSHGTVLYLGEAYKKRKDPEHLPPQNGLEMFGDLVRKLPKFLRSPESAFGFRVACATMSVAIVNLLQDTQQFFLAQRLVWAMIMVAISMTPTAGQSISSFVLRVAGTVGSMVCSIVIWYIPDGHTAGVIVFFYIFVACAFYILIKKPRLIMMGMISIITTTMIIGYELEVRKIGEKAATSNGQPYYPIYELGPYRLATVVGGLAVAFIWTVFPFPISEHSLLRENLGAALYLLANYYSIIHETVAARARGDERDVTWTTSAGRRLDKARHKVFSKQILILNNLQTYSNFLNWEIPIGGRFPKPQYDTIIACIHNIVNYITLVEYASKTFVQLDDSGQASETEWFRDFKHLVVTANITTHQITSLLSLLSASIKNQQPLPPYLQTPRPYGFAERMKALDKNILNISHSVEPGYAAFSVLQLSTRCIIGDLDKLIANVKILVGELDFSFHAVSTTDLSKTESSLINDGEREIDPHKLD